MQIEALSTVLFSFENIPYGILIFCTEYFDMKKGRILHPA